MADGPKKTQTKVNIDFSAEKPVFQWKAAEFAQYKKSGGWYLIVVGAALGLLVVFYFLRNWTAMGVVAAAALALIAQARTKPRSVSVSVYRAGIVVNDRVYPFPALKSFWLIPGEHPTFRLEPTGFFRPSINVPIADEDPEQIRLFLAKFLPEDENRGEDLADIIQRWTRF